MAVSDVTFTAITAAYLNGVPAADIEALLVPVTEQFGEAWTQAKERIEAGTKETRPAEKRALDLILVGLMWEKGMLT